MSTTLVSLPHLALSEQSQDLFFTFQASGLPEAELVVTQFSAEERMSDLYSVTIHLASRRADHDLAQLIDKPAVLVVHDRYTAEPRYFHGVVASAVKGNSGHAYTGYQVTLMPTLHRLRYGSDCRIFQNKNVVDIAKLLLAQHHIDELDCHFQEDHPLREYLTQYHESHLHFFDRILAEEGISYYFRHEKDKHVLVLTDATITAQDVTIDDQLEYNATSGGMTRGHYIRDFVWREQVAVSAVNQRDHFFKKPMHSYQTSQLASAPELEQDLSIYHYPGRYKADKVGQDFSRYSLESWRKDAAIGSGGGRCQYLTAGHCFHMKNHDDKAMNRRYFLTNVRHSGQQAGALEEYAGEGATNIDTTFVCIRDDTPWRADRQVRPRVDGPQMAIVCGPEGEEIHCDEYGRVKIFFPWDRYSHQDDKSSCWIRVASNWAGGLWGHIAIPRIGQHVIVDYLEGDPDQPIVVGRAYNSVNAPPYRLPDHKTRMVIKSKTHKGEGFNELRFEDEKDREEVFIHNNYSRRVNVNHVESIGHNQGIEVANNQTNIIGGDLEISVGPSKSGTITPSGAKTSLYGIGNVAYALGTEENGPKGAGNAKISIEANKLETIGSTHMQMVMRNKQVDVKNNFYINVDGELLIDAGKRMVLKCGQSVIVLNPDGTISFNGKRLSQGFDEIIKLSSDIVKVN